MSGPANRAQRRRAWPKRRQWLDRIADDCRLTSGAKTWLLLLARRSSEAGKPVWGRQTRMADELGRSDRSVRAYSKEAEQLGYLKVYRAKPVRGPDGRWTRRKTNRYYLCLPSRETATQPAPRRRQRAPYCVVTAGPRRQPYLPENDRLSNPEGVRKPPPHPPCEDEPLSAVDAEHPENLPPAAELFAAMRRALHRPTIKGRGR